MRKLLLISILTIFICFGCAAETSTPLNETTEKPTIKTELETSTQENEETVENEETTTVAETEEQSTEIETTVESVKSTTEIVEEPTTQAQEQTVEIIFSVISIDETETIENYVTNLNKDNGNNDFYVYDSTHYAYKTTTSEVQELIAYINNGGLYNEFIQTMNESYPNVCKKAEYRKATKEFVVYVDNELYSNSDFGIDIVIMITSLMYAETIQAYNLVPIAERNTTILILDNDTNELINSF